MINNSAICIGVMSGTSLDGLDIAACSINSDNYNQSKIIVAKTIPYNNKIKDRLKSCYSNNNRFLLSTNVWFGEFIANQVNEFIKENNIKATLIASHGHTVFHSPQDGYTTQIGCGATIAAITGITTICDFRSLDVALGGQGAPLVPIGDQLFYSQYNYCLNLGGIANISYNSDNKRVAFDISPANIPLNYYSNKLGFDYDNNGQLGKDGYFNKELFNELNKLDYYKIKPPKSMGIEWINKYFFPIIEQYSIDEKDKLNTIYEHLAFVISTHLKNKNSNVLVTGGGAHNSFFIETIKKYSEAKLVVPNELTVDFKEAFVFALLGYLRLKGDANTLCSVTGAKRNSCGGAIYNPL